MKKLPINKLAIAWIVALTLGFGGVAAAGEDTDTTAAETAKNEAAPSDDRKNFLVIWPEVLGDDPVPVTLDELAFLLRTGGDNIIVIWPSGERVNPRTVVALEDTHF